MEIYIIKNIIIEHLTFSKNPIRVNSQQNRYSNKNLYNECK